MFSDEQSEPIPYSQFLDEVAAGSVVSVAINNNNGDISGELADGETFLTTGPRELPRRTTGPDPRQPRRT